MRDANRSSRDRATLRAALPACALLAFSTLFIAIPGCRDDEKAAPSAQSGKGDSSSFIRYLGKVKHSNSQELPAAAKRGVEDVLKRTIGAKGDSFFIEHTDSWAGDKHLHEVKSLAVAGTAPSLTEADKLNGITQRYDIMLSAASREYNTQTKAWGDWQAAFPGGGGVGGAMNEVGSFLSFPLVEREGKWADPDQFKPYKSVPDANAWIANPPKR